MIGAVKLGAVPLLLAAGMMVACTAIGTNATGTDTGDLMIDEPEGGKDIRGLAFSALFSSVYDQDCWKHMADASHRQRGQKHMLYEAGIAALDEAASLGVHFNIQGLAAVIADQKSKLTTVLNTDAHHHRDKMHTAYNVAFDAVDAKLRENSVGNFYYVVPQPQGSDEGIISVHGGLAVHLAPVMSWLEHTFKKFIRKAVNQFIDVAGGGAVGAAVMAPAAVSAVVKWADGEFGHVHGRFCGANWCDGKLSKESECQFILPAFGCADTCCQAHDRCCGGAGSYGKCQADKCDEKLVECQKNCVGGGCKWKVMCYSYALLIRKFFEAKLAWTLPSSCCGFTHHVEL